MIDASKILTFANNLEDKHEGKGYKWLYDKLRYEIIKQNQAELNNNEVLDLVSSSFQCCKEENKCSKQCEDCKMVYNCF